MEGADHDTVLKEPNARPHARKKAEDEDAEADVEIVRGDAEEHHPFVRVVIDVHRPAGRDVAERHVDVFVAQHEAGEVGVLSDRKDADGDAHKEDEKRIKQLAAQFVEGHRQLRAPEVEDAPAILTFVLVERVVERRGQVVEVDRDA